MDVIESTVPRSLLKLSEHAVIVVVLSITFDTMEIFNVECWK